MLAPTLFLLVGSPVFHPFTKPLTVVLTERLAITPIIDGKMEAEEWDELSPIEGGKSYFQWEPEKLHAAATLPAGRDLLLSFDLKGDGWLKGKDNLEVRVRMRDGLPEVQTRILDGNPSTGPEWKEATAFQSSAKVAATAEGANWTVELTLADPGRGLLVANPDRRVGVRFDAVAAEEGSHEPFLPRVMSDLKLTLDRSIDLPDDVRWKPEFKGRSVVPGNDTKIRHTFKREQDTEFKRIEVRSEGHARNATGMSGVPFPDFDNKGRAFMDYQTKVASDATLGYRVVRATLTGADGKESVVQSSIQIAPSVTFDIVPPRDLVGANAAQKTKLVVYVRSNTLKRVDGIVNMIAPEGWEVRSGGEEPFIIYNSRGSVRRVFEVVVPPDVKGPYAIKMRANLGTKMIEQTVWITIP